MLGLIWSFFTVSEIHLEVKERVHFKEEERSFWNSDAENPVDGLRKSLQKEEGKCVGGQAGLK